MKPVKTMSETDHQVEALLRSSEVTSDSLLTMPLDQVTPEMLQRLSLDNLRERLMFTLCMGRVYDGRKHLSGFKTKQELAQAIGRTTRTLSKWACAFRVYDRARKKEERIRSWLELGGLEAILADAAQLEAALLGIGGSSADYRAGEVAKALKLGTTRVLRLVEGLPDLSVGDELSDDDWVHVEQMRELLSTALRRLEIAESEPEPEGGTDEAAESKVSTVVDTDRALPDDVPLGEALVVTSEAVGWPRQRLAEFLTKVWGEAIDSLSEVDIQRAVTTTLLGLEPLQKESGTYVWPPEAAALVGLVGDASLAKRLAVDVRTVRQRRRKLAKSRPKGT